MAGLLVDDARAMPGPAAPRAVVIGNFDGVHRGHVEVVRQARRVAGALPLVVLTFEPHPAALFGGSPPPRLTRLDRKAALLFDLGVDAVVAQRFDLGFAALSPAAFVDEVLVGGLSAAKVVVGFDFRFGAKRAGDLATLRALGEGRFELCVQEAVADAAGSFSSTRAREALAAGDLAAVGAVLGRPHAVEGVVRKGDQRGRTIGFPTANVGEIEEALPRNGVYAVAVDVADEAGRFSALATGVANVGVRPTVATGAAPSLEAHLFDLPASRADLYGARLRVHFVARLRDERRFSGLDELRAQIAADATGARAAVRSLAARAPGAAFW